MSPRLIVCGVVTALLIGGSVSAHHNMSAVFDFNNRVAISGTLAKVDWRNPHIELTVDTKDGQRAQPWRLEGPSRARDGSAYGLLRTMKLPSGKLVSACPQNC
jgi:hypothetical protein